MISLVAGESIYIVHTEHIIDKSRLADFSIDRSTVVI